MKKKSTPPSFLNEFFNFKFPPPPPLDFHYFFFTKLFSLDSKSSSKIQHFYSPFNSLSQQWRIHKQHKSKRSSNKSLTASSHPKKVQKFPKFHENLTKCSQNFTLDFSKLVQQRQLLDGQLSENQNVLEEMNRLTEDKNTVYKLIGPILVKQSLTESKQNVTKRIDYISKELQKCNDRIAGLEKDQEKQRENMTKLQQQLSVLNAMS